jgi:Protein of unknown function (DUF2721)
MNPANGFSLDISHAIQLALAPVFLFSGIAALLGVMAGRLGRIIDRGRKLLEGPPSNAIRSPEKIALELRTLERRRRMTSKAITVTTLAELLVCLVIATLFLEVLMDLPLKWIVGVLFTAATLALVIGLAFFLREIHLGNQTVRIELERAATQPGP